MKNKNLYIPGYSPQLAPEDALAVTREFLLFCRSWATEKEIPKRRDELQDSQDSERVARLQAWLSYVEFTDHAIEELESGTLDHWFKARDRA